MIEIELPSPREGFIAQWAIGKDSWALFVAQGLPTINPEFVAERVPRLPIEPSVQWLHDLEQAIGSRDTGSRSQVTQFVFVGLVAAGPTISVLHAGDLRVALLSAGQVLGTRDHIVANRSTEERLRDEFASLTEAALPTMLTRWVGPECHEQPERTNWTVNGNYELIVSSSDIHQHRSEPVAWLSDTTSAGWLARFKQFADRPGTNSQT